MTPQQIEAMKLALEALYPIAHNTTDDPRGQAYKAITALEEVLAQPEFIEHEVENADDWSEWVCPNPSGYLMKCCDCGLVHEAQFRVAKYQPKPSEDFVVADDPDLQAQFRMRRNEQWSPKDTAYRPGGLAQPEQEPLEYWNAVEGWVKIDEVREHFDSVGCGTIYKSAGEGRAPLYTTPPQRKPLTDEEISEIAINNLPMVHEFARAIEAAHGIKENT